jgi:O-antigen ligase
MLVSSFWLIAWAAFLSWCWLLPNHYLPWTAFHMDAWAAAMYLPMSAAVLWLTRTKTGSPATALVVLVLSTVPWLQYLAGMIPFAGTAWIPFGYLLGLALAILVGFRWEAASPGQVGDGLFLAIGVASAGSVGLQLHQWLQLNWTDIWSMGIVSGRPYANFGQPNQLATLLLWGVLGIAWGVWRQHIRPMFAVLATVFLLFGLALTASRTAWIGVLVLTTAAWYWRGLGPSRAAPWFVTGLAVCFFALVWMIPYLGQYLLLSAVTGDVDTIARISSELRPRIWAMFGGAIGQRPWLGYGWNQVATAHVNVALDYSPLGSLFAHAHNLILDLLIWNGIPLGLTVCGLIAVWIWARFRAVKDPGSALLFLLLVIVGNHAMLELPLHYAYFLLPAGLVVGALDVRLQGRMLAFGRSWLAAALWLMSATLLALLVRDYTRIESGYQVLRFEWANIRTNASREPPDVLLLDQLRDVIAFSRFEPDRDITDARLGWMRRLANLYPTAGVIHKLATVLAWKHQPAEAALWLRRMCAVVPAGQCKAVKAAWENQAKTDPLVAKVPWPN